MLEPFIKAYGRDLANVMVFGAVSAFSWKAYAEGSNAAAWALLLAMLAVTVTVWKALVS